MSENEAKTETVEMHDDDHHQLPLVQTAITLAIITIIELLISDLEGSIWVILLLVLTFAKMVLIASIFMEVAYSKETTRIVLYVFVVPVIAFMILLLAIANDWRTGITA